MSPHLEPYIPSLKNLQDKRDTQLKGAQKRKVYTLTPLGSEAYKVALEVSSSTIPYIYKAIEDNGKFLIEDVKRCFLVIAGDLVLIFIAETIILISAALVGKGRD